MNAFNNRRTRRPHDSGRASPLDDLRFELERLWDRFFPQDPPEAQSPEAQSPAAQSPEADPPEAEETAARPAAWTPNVDLDETATEVSVRVELPGVEPGSVDLSVLGDKLTLAGEKKPAPDPAEGSRRRLESSFGSFRRVVRLPAEVDAASASAEFKHGVLFIRFRKPSAAAPKKIHVQGGGAV